MLVGPSARAQQIERTVDGDAVQPRDEVRALLEIAQLAVGAQESLLHDVVGIMFISSHAIGHPKHRFGVTLDQLPEGVGIAGSGPAHHGNVGGHLHHRNLRLDVQLLVRCRGWEWGVAGGEWELKNDRNSAADEASAFLPLPTPYSPHPTPVTITTRPLARPLRSHLRRLADFHLCAAGTACRA